MNTPSQNNRRRERFFVWVAIGAALIVFIGFARTYFLKEVFSTSPLSILLHVHAVVISLWFVLFIVQTQLVAARQISAHRQLGVVAAVVATLVVLVGMEVAFNASKRGFLANPSSSRDIQGFAILCGFLLDFSVLVGAALYFRRRPDIHKRLMLLGSCSILAPAISRIPVEFIKSADLWLIFGLLDLLVLVSVIYDTIRNRALHGAFGWGGLFLVATFPSTLIIARAASWVQLAKWLFYHA